ncbi:MAG: NAD(P)/FAD-dependent oxidoreductase [Proteobacteria bacterium]|nr:NAD(P)/FAD-dependent oxidoreductase [Pseudomonadota bacterium]
MYDFKIAIIGAGVVGLSCAYYLSNFFQDIVVFEKNESYGLETSSRNSEVIHSGIYYPENTKKAKFCVRGRRLLYNFCERYGINHAKVGKLILAINDSEEKELIKLYEQGMKNDVEGLEVIDIVGIRRLESNARGRLAIYSKETGIIDSHGLMKRLYLLSKDKGVLFAFKGEVKKIIKSEMGYQIFTSKEESINSKYIINAGGLYSDRIAQMMGINIDEAGYRLSYHKGDYFYYSKPSLVKRLVYPIPHRDLKGLGIHITVDLGGRMKLGPDVYEVSSIDYGVDPEKRDMFYEKATLLLDGIDRNALFPDMSGIRPKLKGEGIRDFIVNEESDKGLRGVINLIGIESPGLTSSLAIGEYVTNILRELDN